MSLRPLQVLLIEDDADHAALVKRHLAGIVDRPVRLEWVDRLEDGLARLADDAFDAVLLDLGLPDSEPSETLPRLTSDVPELPVIVLTTLDDLELAAQTVQSGAQDYLVKMDLRGDLLLRSIRYAIERKRNEVELARSNRELEQFAHVVAHEVKTPLSIVLYCCELIRRYEDRFDPETRDFIDSTRQAARGMAELINHLLDYASVGSRETTAVPIDLALVLDQALAALQVAVAESGAVVTHDPLPTVRADPVQLDQLLRNLIGNAIKYRGEEAPRIHVGARRAESGEAEWIVSVRDNGIGLDPCHAERIFELFHRAHPMDQYGGTGIGLSICKRIVESHGGRIWVESSPGSGSIFYFTLPA